MTTNDTTPRRGEVWDINLDPTRGQEIQKTRPAVVISSDAIGKLRLKIIVPITDWKAAFSENIWHVSLRPSPTNGLTKDSAADALQVRSVSFERFTRKRGRITQTEIEEIIQALAAVVEFS
jgi:mRNA interferase MazF